MKHVCEVPLAIAQTEDVWWVGRRYFYRVLPFFATLNSTERVQHSVANGRGVNALTSLEGGRFATSNGTEC